MIRLHRDARSGPEGRRGWALGGIGLLVLFSVLLVGCAGSAATVPTALPTAIPVASQTSVPPAVPPPPTVVAAVPTRGATATALATTVEPTAVVAARVPTASAQAAFWAKWQASPHGNTYDLGKGPNTFCSRCHSPLNWDPAAKPDAPPNCVSCKFETDATVRIAKSNPLVSQADWKNIGCEVCHRMENGTVNAALAWYNQATKQYEPVVNATALCEKCHTDTDVLRHRRDLGKSAHTNFQCAQCHDAHTTKASCTASQCHAKLSQVPGHDQAHATVSCVACHDAAALSVGPDAKTKIWTTWRTTEVIGRKTTATYVSHNLQKSVECARCHFAGNPWKLPESGKKSQ